MILTDEQLKERHDSPDNLKNILHKITGKGQHKNQSRGEGNKEIPVEKKALIALTAKLDTAKNVAEAFGVSESTVNACKAGVTSLNPNTRSEEKSKELSLLIKEKEEKLTATATDKLMKALELVDPEDDVKLALQMTSIARNLADIRDKLRPVKEHNGGINVTIYSPPQRNVSTYETIEITPN